MTSRQLWKTFVTITEEQRQKELVGFNYRISILVALGTKLFGHKKDYIINAAISEKRPNVSSL